jgi:tape measure domain-containing protein
MATVSNNDIRIKYVLDTSELKAASQEFDKLTAGEKKAAEEAKKLNKEVSDMGEKAKKAGKSGAEFMGIFDNALNGLQNKIAGIFAVGTIIAFGKSVLDTTIRMEKLNKVLEFTAGSAAMGALNFKFIKDTANEMGISVDAAANGFKSLSGSALQLGYTNTQVQKIFKDVSKAIAAFGLSAEDSQGVFLALSQIMSKGVVSAEELRGQIGERLYGAFSIAAKSMKMTETELIAVMKAGKLTATEFIIPFTNHLGEMTDKASKVDNLGKTFARLGNSWTELMTNIGRQVQEGGVFGGALKLAQFMLDNMVSANKTASQRIMDTQATVTDFAMSSYADLTEAERKQEYDKLRAIEKTQIKQVDSVKLVGKAYQDNYGVVSKAFAAIGIKGFGYQQGELLQTYQTDLANTQGKIVALAQLEKERLQLLEAAKKASAAKGETDQKGLEKEYEAKLKIIAKDEEIAKNLAIAKAPGKYEQTKAELQNQINFNNIRFNLDQQYYNKGVTVGKQNSQLRVAENKKVNAEIEQNYVDHNDKLQKEGVAAYEEEIKLYWKNVDEIEKMFAEIDKLYAKNYKDRQDAIQSTGKIEIENIKAEGLSRNQENKSIIQSKISTNEKLIAEANNAAKMQIDGAKETADELRATNAALGRDLIDADQAVAQDRADIYTGFAQLAQTVTNGLFDRYQENLANELSASSTFYDEQIRLAGDNVQRVTELKEKQRAKEKEIKRKQWEASQLAAVADVVFRTAPIIAGQLAGVFTAPLAIISQAIAATEIAFILSQKPPEFKDGTKGKPFKGGLAVVGDGGESELVRTSTGDLFWTPAKSTLVNLPKGAEVFNQKQISEQFLFGSQFANQSGRGRTDNRLVDQLTSIESTLKGLPITQISMNERGFEKYIRTERRTTKILNNRFPSN